MPQPETLFGARTKTSLAPGLATRAKEGLLIQSGRRSPDMISGEPTGRIIAYRAKDGKVLWDKEKDVDDGPYLLAHGIIYMQNSQYSPSNALKILTGEEVMTKHPLTGQTVPWHFMRNKGCSSVIGCENLLTFRSGAAAYYDLTNNGGIGHFGGFKSGCSSNLVPANGVLSAPDYTRSCNCSYQNQTSLALVHMPEVETWTHGAADHARRPHPASRRQLRGSRRSGRRRTALSGWSSRCRNTETRRATGSPTRTSKSGRPRSN